MKPLVLLAALPCLWLSFFPMEPCRPPELYWFQQEYTVNKPIEYPSKPWQDEEKGWHPGGGY